MGLCLLPLIGCSVGTPEERTADASDATVAPFTMRVRSFERVHVSAETVRDSDEFGVVIKSRQAIKSSEDGPFPYSTFSEVQDRLRKMAWQSEDTRYEVQIEIAATPNQDAMMVISNHNTGEYAMAFVLSHGPDGGDSSAIRIHPDATGQRVTPELVANFAADIIEGLAETSDSQSTD